MDAPHLGFMLVDLLAREAGREVRRSECRALVGLAEIERRRVEWSSRNLHEPERRVGRLPVGQAARVEAASDLMVVCDDLALPFGTIRLSRGGRPAGTTV